MGPVGGPAVGGAPHPWQRKTETGAGGTSGASSRFAGLSTKDHRYAANTLFIEITNADEGGTLNLCLVSNF